MILTCNFRTLGAVIPTRCQEKRVFSARRTRGDEPSEQREPALLKVGSDHGRGQDSVRGLPLQIGLPRGYHGMGAV